MLLTIPLAWLTGYGMQAWIEWRTSPRRRIAAATLVALALALPMATPLPRLLHEETYGRRHALDPQVIEILTTQTTTDDWFFTDRPTYAYLTQRRVPPHVALQTRKRWRAGQVTHDELLEALRTYEPRHVVLERYEDEHYGSEVLAYLDQYYEMHRLADPPRDGLRPLRHFVRQERQE